MLNHRFLLMSLRWPRRPAYATPPDGLFILFSRNVSKVYMCVETGLFTPLKCPVELLDVEFVLVVDPIEKDLKLIIQVREFFLLIIDYQ